MKRKAIFDTLPLIFDAIDTNADGQIEIEEFKAYFESFGIIDHKYSIEIFKELDANHDLMLSKQGKHDYLFNQLGVFLIKIFLFFLEFVDAGIDFFMGLDNSTPSKYFFGPLHN